MSRKTPRTVACWSGAISTKPQADEGPFPQISQLYRYVVFNAVA
jgi:hypothetical protein